MSFLPPFLASALTEPTFGKEALGAEPGHEKCHAEFISASQISESIYINPESRLSDLIVASRGATGDKFRIRDPETSSG